MAINDVKYTGKNSEVKIDRIVKDGVSFKREGSEKYSINIRHLVVTNGIEREFDNYSNTMYVNSHKELIKSLKKVFKMNSLTTVVEEGNSLIFSTVCNKITYKVFLNIN